ncbi:MAG: hypothetical protein ACTSR3_23085 [Candidatus Helarchaeota archaeon]
MSNLPEAKENFAEAAISHLSAAKIALETEGLKHKAFEEAWYCGECSFKAVLDKAGKYIDAPIRRRGDKHHEWHRHYRKIKDEDLLPTSLTSLVLDSLTEDLYAIDVSSDDEHVNCGPTCRSLIGDIR